MEMLLQKAGEQVLSGVSFSFIINMNGGNISF